MECRRPKENWLRMLAKSQAFAKEDRLLISEALSKLYK